MKEIPLVGRLGLGRVVLVDDSDYKWLSAYAWRCFLADSNYYAKANIGGKYELMHRLLVPGARYVDHIDRNGLNNCRSNLRAASASQNGANSCGKPKGRTCRFKGITKWGDGQRYRAHITVQRQTRYLGSFLTDVEAALAYDRAALIAWGEFACLNFPNGLKDVDRKTA